MNMVQGFITRLIPFIMSLHWYMELGLPDRVSVLKVGEVELLGTCRLCTHAVTAAATSLSSRVGGCVLLMSNIFLIGSIFIKWFLCLR